MATPLQDWLHGTLDTISKAEIDTRKKVEPKLAGTTANNVMETKGIVDNALTIGATIGTVIAKAAGSSVPVSGDQYDAIRWLTRGGHDDVLNPKKEFPDNPDIDTRPIGSVENVSYTEMGEIDTSDPSHNHTIEIEQTQYEINAQPSENDHIKVQYNQINNHYDSYLLSIGGSPYTNIDEQGRTLSGSQLYLFNKYVNNAIVSGLTPDDPKQYKDKNAKLSPGYTPQGTRSLFNNWRIVSMNGNGFGNSQHFIDKPESRSKQLEMYKCDTETLIQKTREGKMGRETFQWSDFMFCTYNGMVSNEHLITLRKFSTPVADNILYNTDKGSKEKSTFNRPAVGTMVTWLGVSGNEMPGLLEFSFHQNTTSPQLDQEEDFGAGNGGIMSKVGHMMDKKRASMALAGGPNPFGDVVGYDKLGTDNIKINRNGGEALVSNVKDFHASKNKNAIWRNNRVIQPKKIEDFGVDYTHSIKLTFEYDLMSYGGVNGRQAFMDLISNILITCYNECSWYGQAYRNVGTEPNQIINELYKGISGSKSAMDNFSTLANNMFNQLKNLFNGDIKEVATTFLNNLGNSVLGDLMNKLGRNAWLGVASNMSDSPLGNWHVTVGNPCRPIASIGNLWMDECKITLNGPLNIDGFPTKITVETSLSPCADRDVAKLEMLFGNGLYRTYYHAPAEALTKMYSARNTEVKEVSVSGKSFNNETGQTEHEATIDASDNASNAKGGSSSNLTLKEVSTSIADLGCSGTGDENMIENT